MRYCYELFHVSALAVVLRLSKLCVCCVAFKAHHPSGYLIEPAAFDQC